jgi:putative DNA primase/helicase
VSPAKHPLTNHKLHLQHGLKDASRDEHTVRSWWTEYRLANIGGVTGAASGRVVLDVDPGHGGTESLVRLTHDHEVLPETVQHETGGGGVHLIFRDPGSIQSSAGKLGAGLDVRGEGGYIVLPPSNHASGARYTVTRGRSADEVSEALLPDWLTTLLRVSVRRVGPGTAMVVEERIPEGRRHSELLSLAGSMRRRGMSPAAIAAALLAENSARCEPPLSEAEVWEIARSVVRYPAGASSPRYASELDALLAHVEENGDELDQIARRAPEPEAPAPEDHTASKKGAGGQDAPAPPWHRTDSGNAEMLAEMFGDSLRFDHARERWLLWSERYWKRDADGEVQRLALLVARERLRRAADIPDKKEYEAAVKHALASEHRSRRDAMLALAQSERPIADAGDSWDADLFLLGVPNGVVDLRTGTLRPGRHEDRITMQAGVAFDPKSTCPRWLKFLDEIFDRDAALVGFVQRAAGYSLTADTTEQVWFGCYGSGANGKSTFLEAIRGAAGDYAVNASFSAFEMHARAAIPQDMARLAGRRLVTASETNEGVRLNEARIKALSGGDRITARRLYENEWEFDPTHKLWLSFNHRPAVGDDSPAFWRRVRLIPFERTIPEDQRDNRLGEKLRGERAGILAWMVCGCLAWYDSGSRGLKVPATVRDATETYREESDPLGAFLANECILEPAARATSAELWTRYREYTRGDAAAVHTQRSFGDRLRAHGFEPDRSHSGRLWIGLRLRHGEELL